MSEFVVEIMLFMRDGDEVTNVRAVTRRVEANEPLDALSRYAESAGGVLTQVLRPSYGRASGIMTKGNEIYRLVAFEPPATIH